MFFCLEKCWKGVLYRSVVKKHIFCTIHVDKDFNSVNIFSAKCLERSQPLHTCACHHWSGHNRCAIAFKHRCGAFTELWKIFLFLLPFLQLKVTGPWIVGFERWPPSVGSLRAPRQWQTWAGFCSTMVEPGDSSVRRAMLTSARRGHVALLTPFLSPTSPTNHTKWFPPVGWKEDFVYVTIAPWVTRWFCVVLWTHMSLSTWIGGEEPMGL